MIAGIKRLVNIYILLFIYYYGRAQLTKWPGHGHSARCRGVVYRVCVCVWTCWWQFTPTCSCELRAAASAKSERRDPFIRSFVHPPTQALTDGRTHLATPSIVRRVFVRSASYADKEAASAHSALCECDQRLHACTVRLIRPPRWLLGSTDPLACPVAQQWGG